MPVIEVKGLTKTFRTYKKQPGFGGAIKGLFHRQYEQTVAVKNVSFNIEPGKALALVGRTGPLGQLHFHKHDHVVDNSPAQADLGFAPRSLARGISESFD